MSSGDHSVTARVDGKFTYCFSNEGWASASKEVAFNIHGIVYIHEDEPTDPLDIEGITILFPISTFSLYTIANGGKKSVVSQTF